MEDESGFRNLSPFQPLDQPPYLTFFWAAGDAKGCEGKDSPGVVSRRRMPWAGVQALGTQLASWPGDPAIVPDFGLGAHESPMAGTPGL